MKLKLPVVLCVLWVLARLALVITQAGLTCEGAFCNDPETQPGSSRNPPSTSHFYFLHGFLAFIVFSLKNGFSNLMARLCTPVGVLNLRGCCPGWRVWRWFSGHQGWHVGVRRGLEGF